MNTPTRGDSSLVSRSQGYSRRTIIVPRAGASSPMAHGAGRAGGAAPRGPGEAEFVQPEAEPLGQVLDAGRDPHPHAQHHQVELLLLLRAAGREVANARVPGAGH